MGEPAQTMDATGKSKDRLKLKLSRNFELQDLHFPQSTKAVAKKKLNLKLGTVLSEKTTPSQSTVFTPSRGKELPSLHKKLNPLFIKSQQPPQLEEHKERSRPRQLDDHEHSPPPKPIPHQRKESSIVRVKEFSLKGVPPSATLNLPSKKLQPSESQIIDLHHLLFGANPPVVDPATVELLNHDVPKISQKRNGAIMAYGANTNQGIIRDYNEDRVSIILNIVKPAGKVCPPWPKCSFFGVYHGHGGANCADFLRDNLHHLVVGDVSFPANPREAL